MCLKVRAAGAQDPLQSFFRLLEEFSLFCVVVGYWLGASLSSERASEYFAKRSPLSSKPSVSALSSQSLE